MTNFPDHIQHIQHIQFIHHNCCTPAFADISLYPSGRCVGYSACRLAALAAVLAATIGAMCRPLAAAAPPPVQCARSARIQTCVTLTGGAFTIGK